MSLLLSEVTLTDVVSAIVLIAIILAAGGLIYYRLKKTPNGKKELQNFFNSIIGLIEKRVLEILDELDLKTLNKDNFAESYQKFIDNIINDIWNLCQKKLEEMYKEDNEVLYTILEKTITIDHVRDIVTVIIDKDNVQDKFADIFNTLISPETSKMIEEDKRLEEEAKENFIEDIEKVSEDEIKANDNSSIPVMDPTRIAGVDYDINPEADKEEESDVVSADDASVEVIEETNMVDAMEEVRTSGDDGEPVETE